MASTFAQALAARAPAVPIDVAVARDEHARYCEALRACGADVITIDAEDACPDCVFVEDTAVVCDGLALVTTPGARSRRAETTAVEAALRDLAVLVVRMSDVEPHATLDGGDVMRVGRRLFVARSARTNDAGIAVLRKTFAPLAMKVDVVALPSDVLHLKCVCSPLDDGRVLVADGALPPDTFGDGGGDQLELVTIPRAEAYAANAVCVGRDVVVAAGHPRTAEALTIAGFVVHAVPASQVQKADGSLTCQSILVKR